MTIDLCVSKLRLGLGLRWRADQRGWPEKGYAMNSGIFLRICMGDKTYNVTSTVCAVAVCILKLRD